MTMHSLFGKRLLTLSIIVGTTAMLSAADNNRVASKPAAAKPSIDSVEMFAAIKSGEIEVKLIPKSDREANVQLTNKTKRPLTVRLPDAFAGVPVLAQAGGGGGGRRGGAGGGGANNQNQGMGGGMGGMGGGMMGGGMGGGGMGMGGMGGGGGGGFFNVPAEKLVQFKVDTVCLEHGKKDPRPAVPYEIRPIESFTKKPAVQELCKLLGLGGVNQRAAQAAAWHLTDNMSWDQLAAKELEHLSGPNEPYFTQEELQAAMTLVTEAENLAAQRKPATSPATSSDAATNDAAASSTRAAAGFLNSVGK